MSILNDLQEKFKISEYLIYETEYWIWSLRPQQVTLGAGILSPKKEYVAFSELRQEEFSDLNNIIKVIENTLKKAFDYDIINFLMLMMVDKQVHYHIIPRYERTIECAGLSWNDLGWPGLPNLATIKTELEVLDKILSIIKENIVA